MISAPFKVAAVQAAPVFLDLEATLAKACSLIAEAARAGAKLIVFPEAFVPGYPDWVWMVPPRERAAINELYGELLANAVAVPGKAIARLGEAARTAGAHVAIGVNERNDEASGSSLYNTLLFFGPDGRLMGRHRKLIPTGGERLMWAQGDGSTLKVYDTPLGKLAGLLCWENYMPLARYALYARGVQILLAPTWDRGDPWLATLRHIGREGRAYVIGCCQALRIGDVPNRYAFKKLYPPGREWINAGDSAIVDPDGNVVAGPLHEKQEILYAELDPRRMSGPRWMFDSAGHYARPDVFQLRVNLTPRPMLEVGEGAGNERGPRKSARKRATRAKATTRRATRAKTPKRSPPRTGRRQR